MAHAYGLISILRNAYNVDLRHRRKLIREARYTNAAMNMSDDEFIAHYRVSKDIFKILVQDLYPYLKTAARKSAVTAKHKILIALSFYGTGSYQRLVGRSHGLIVTQSTVSRILKEVTLALNETTIIRKHIKFPNLETRNAIKRKFYEKYGLPGVFGCIDGTHIAMVRPHINEERFFNRKHFHSRNVQIVCDFDLNIISVDASFGGATHDSFIFNNHPIKTFLMGLSHTRGETSCLLGDSGYAQREYLMTPILNAADNSPEELYNKIHCSARSRVERAIGLLKARWRCLLKHRVLHYNPAMVAKITYACCVLHNMCNSSNCALPPSEDITSIIPAEAEDIVMPDEINSSEDANTDELRRGMTKRATIVTALWNQRGTSSIS